MMTIEQKLYELSQIFRVQVDGYILADLRNIMPIQPDSNGFGGCAVPAAMAIIAAMEMFGTYITSNPDTSRGKDYLVKFIQTYIPEISEDDRNKLIFNYRNKMMHIYFGDITTTKIFSISKIAYTTELIEKRDSYLRILSVPKLYELFLHGVERLRNKIFVEKDMPIIDTFFTNIQISNDDNSGVFTSSTITGQTTIPPTY
jgi:hypothetical protein